MTTTTHTTLPPDLLAAVLDDPASDSVRLVCADWLEEHGEGERSEFIRVQIELAKINESRMHSATVSCGTCKDCRPIAAMARRERELFREHVLYWCDAAFGPLNQITLPDNATTATAIVGFGPDADVPIEFTWRRGFVASAKCKLAAWISEACHHNSRYMTDHECAACSGTGRLPGHGRAIMASHPVETVSITDKSPNGTDGHEVWWSEARGGNELDWWIPSEVHLLLTGMVTRPRSNHKRYKTIEAAMADLSTALLALGRRP